MNYTVNFTLFAMEYTGNPNPRNARRQMMRYINHDEELKEALTRVGFRPGLRIISPAILEVFIRILGEPLSWREEPVRRYRDPEMKGF